MHNKHSWFHLSILSVGLLIIAACGGNLVPPEPLELTINMSEYSFSPNTIEAKVGQTVTLHLVNLGTLDHEIMFGRGVVFTEGRPNGFDVDMFQSLDIHPEVTGGGTVMDIHNGEGMMMGEEPMGEHTHTGFMVMLPVDAGETTMTFTVTEEMLGEWEIGCFLLDGVHYDSGMHGKFTVSR